MLRDNLVGLIEPMLSSAGANPLALCTARKKPSDDRPPCLENPRPAGAESTLTENAASPFHAEPKHLDVEKWLKALREEVGLANPTCAKVRAVMACVYKHARSEEHTSELQSRQYLVCRL